MCTGECCTAASVEAPVNLDTAIIEVCEILEGNVADVDVVVGTLLALVDNDSLGGLAVVVNGDMLAADGIVVGIAASLELIKGQSDNTVRNGIGDATSTKARSVVSHVAMVGSDEANKGGDDNSSEGLHCE